ncbi:MAG: TIGR03960 family B12-binding radical SAM protein [Nitrospirota bacterium]|nr:TIGR03960 family B12-binding radical SAM protein [Nitrospirota bacterium]
MPYDFLPLVSKPARYIGGEVNSVRKDRGQVRTTVALCFPDVYEVGMSHLGLKILYEILNQRPDTAAERVYSPWGDYEEELRKRNLPLTSLETHTPLADFDILGFTVQYEMSYTNILNMLDLGRIPLKSVDRGDNDPLVITGGPGVFNIEPMADFLDAVLIGDGEEAINDIVECHARWKASGKDRAALLLALAEIEGVYIPSHFSPTCGDDGRVTAIHTVAGPKEAVRKRFLADLESAPSLRKPVLPHLRVIHDRVTLEVARGCTRGCRFCYAGIVYRPVRERTPQTVEKIMADSIACTGYEEVSIASLSTGDYSGLAPLLHSINRDFSEDRVSVSLPSLRVETLTADVINEIRQVRKTGFTLAPEAGTERLRRVINKVSDDRDLEITAANIFRAGWDHIKLYFMIGLPTETDEDLVGIAELAERLVKVGRSVGRRRPTVTVSASTFVPKPHTPFQWCSQISVDEINRRQDFLRRECRKRRVDYKGHDARTSFLEAVFSKGDRRLGKVILNAWQSGCRFDGWTEMFAPERWKAAFDAAGLDPEFYAYREIGLDEVLPWDHIDTGVTKKFLLREYQDSLVEKVTIDCRYAHCVGCGVCDKGGKKREVKGEEPRRVTTSEPVELTEFVPSTSGSPKGFHYRLTFSKTGPIRYLSHLDLTSVFARAAARAHLPIAYSSGFNPHPRLSFGPPLAVGQEGMMELLDIELTRYVAPKALEERFNAVLPEGVCVSEVGVIAPSTASISASVAGYTYSVVLPVGHEMLDRAATDFMAAASRSVLRTSPKGTKTVDIRPLVKGLAVYPFESGSELIMELGDDGGRTARPSEVIAVLTGLAEEEIAILKVARRALTLKGDLALTGKKGS